MLSNGEWIREKLIEAGDKGVVIADLQKERRERHAELSILYRGGRYHSFARYFAWFIQLGWVEPTGETETAFTKGNETELKSPRKYYRITDLGESVPELLWRDPIVALHPKWTPSERVAGYRLPTGRVRGRPRKAPPKPPKKVVRKPPKKKPPKVELSEEEKARLVFMFVEDFGRKPTKAELNELYSEELKIKRAKMKEK